MRNNFFIIKNAYKHEQSLILTSLSMSVLTALSVSDHANNKSEETVKLDTIVVVASSQAVNIKL